MLISGISVVFQTISMRQIVFEQLLSFSDSSYHFPTVSFSSCFGILYSSIPLYVLSLEDSRWSCDSLTRSHLWHQNDLLFLKSHFFMDLLFTENLFVQVS